MRYRIKWKQLVQSIVSIGFLWLMIKILVMTLYESESYFKSLMPLIGYTEDSTVYYILHGISQMEHGRYILQALIVLEFLIAIVAFFVFLRQYVGKKLLVIQHSSLPHMSFSYDSKEINEYAIKRFSIDQCKTCSNGSIPLNEMVALLITEIENKIPLINKYIDKGYQIGYAGIPVGNIPCVFMLGYELDDANKKVFFHKYRNNSTDDSFHILKEEKVPIRLQSDVQKNDNDLPGKLLVIIELTQPVKDEDLYGVSEENDYVLRYSVLEQIDYDIVTSVVQMDEYIDNIMRDINDVQKRPNISEIKICVAASSVFVFALGSKFSKTQNIDTIIYQFNKGRYSWGINVTKKKAVVVDGDYTGLKMKNVTMNVSK